MSDTLTHILLTYILFSILLWRKPKVRNREFWFWTLTAAAIPDISRFYLVLNYLPLNDPSLPSRIMVFTEPIHTPLLAMAIYFVVLLMINPKDKHLFLAIGIVTILFHFTLDLLYNHVIYLGGQMIFFPFTLERYEWHLINPDEIFTLVVSVILFGIILIIQLYGQRNLQMAESG